MFLCPLSHGSATEKTDTVRFHGATGAGAGAKANARRFRKLGINVDNIEADELWEILDADRSGEIDEERGLPQPGAGQVLGDRLASSGTADRSRSEVLEMSAIPGTSKRCLYIDSYRGKRGVSKNHLLEGPGSCYQVSRREDLDVWS